jgi:hypothetical protein
VESFRRLLRRKHADVLREPGVERLYEIARANRVCQPEARDLTERVHARIGPAGSRNSHASPFYRRQRNFELFLNRSCVCLALESGEVGAVVRNDDLECAHLRGARTGFDDWNALSAERALVGRIRRYLELHERTGRYAEIGCSAAPIDNRRGADDLCSRRASDVDCFARRLARGKDVLDDEHAIAWRQTEAASQAQRRPARSLREDRPNAERARHLVPDDQPAQGRRQDNRWSEIFQLRRDSQTKRLSVRGVLKNQRRLEVTRTVKPR